MGLVLAALLIVVLFGLGGFALHALWVVAVVLFIAWLVGFAFRGGENAHWYHR